MRQRVRGGTAVVAKGVTGESSKGVMGALGFSTQVHWKGGKHKGIARF